MIKQFFFKVWLTTTLLALFIVALPENHYVSASDKSVQRINGSDRFATAIEVSKEGWKNGADTVILANGYNFPDALTGSPLAYKLDAPILLTGDEELNLQTKKEIQRLGAKNVVILGGEKVVSSQVQTDLQKMNIDVERISGENRYETTSAIADELNSKSTNAIIVSGNEFPDSLAIASWAAQNGYPILMTNKHSIPEATKQALKRVRNTIVIGGENAISERVYKQLPSPRRISGDDRFETATDVIKIYMKDASNPHIATGMSFADALTGSVLAAKKEAPIILVKPDGIPPEVNELIHQQAYENFSIIGGNNAISKDVENLLLDESNVDKLIEDAKALRGIPYKWGGTTTSGFDCSGFIQYVFKKHDVSLPRTTSSMWNYGSNVSKPSKGDLVFFNTSGKGVSHAGIYIGNNEFIHSSSSRGVSISSMSNSYWNPRYLGSKSVLD